jgi:hypothetical protein
VSATTLKFSKKMENRVRERALFLLLTEKVDLDEVSINWLGKLPGALGKAFNKEREEDERTANEPIPDVKIDKVNIPLPISDEDAPNILKNSEVQNLLKAFFARWDISSSSAQNDFAKAIQLDPTNTIKRYTLLAAVDNVATKGDEKSKAINPDNPGNPTGETPKKSSNEISIQNEIIPAMKDKETTWNQVGRETKQILSNLLGYKVVELPRKHVGKDSIRKILQDKGWNEKQREEFLGIIGDKEVIKEQLAITNLSETDIAELVNEINKFYPYAKEYLGFDRPVELTLISDPDNAKDTFGKTAYYSPKNEQMTIFVDERHPKDIIRSFSHELVHHAQNCRGEFDRDFRVGENYIETDDHLKEMEREAYDKGNMCLRTYESYLKKENKTMNEKTLRKSIREAIKRVVENKTHAVKETTEETVVTEDSGEDEAWHQWKNEHADDDHIKEIEHHLHALRDDRDYEEHGAEYDHDKYEDEGMDETADVNTGLENPIDKPEGTSYGHVKEEVVEEDEDYTAKKEKPGEDKRKGAEERGAEGTLAKTKGHGKVDYVNEDESTATPLYESMAIKKGQLVFDRLVNKWCK